MRSLVVVSICLLFGMAPTVVLAASHAHQNPTTISPTFGTPGVSNGNGAGGLGNGFVGTSSSSSQGGSNPSSPDFSLPDGNQTEIGLALSAHLERDGQNSQCGQVSIIHANTQHWGTGGILEYSNDASWQISSALFAERYSLFSRSSHWKVKPFVIGLLGVADTKDKNQTTPAAKIDLSCGGATGLEYALSDSSSLQMCYQVLYYRSANLTKGDVTVALCFYR